MCITPCRFSYKLTFYLVSFATEFKFLKTNIVVKKKKGWTVNERQHQGQMPNGEQRVFFLI